MRKIILAHYGAFCSFIFFENFVGEVLKNRLCRCKYSNYSRSSDDWLLPQFIFGKHSGRNSLKYALGEHIAESELDPLLQKIKRIAEQHKVRFTEQEVLDLYFYPEKFAEFEQLSQKIEV